MYEIPKKLLFSFIILVYTAISNFAVLPTNPQYKLTFSTYLGGTESAEGKDIAVDSSGNTYIIGETKSKDFSLIGKQIKNEEVIEKENAIFSKSFIQKFDSEGNLIYSSFLTNCSATNIIVKSDKEIYISGRYNSKTNCVTPNAFQNRESDQGIFVMKIDISLGKILYSAHLGGKNGVSYDNSISIDKDKNIYIAGDTSADDFPVTNDALQHDFIKVSKYGSHGFLAKLDSSGESLIYSTFLQGSGFDYVSDMILDSQDNIYLVGSTDSKDFPVTPDAYQKKSNAIFDDSNGFLTKLNKTGSKILYSTFIGGSSASADLIAINETGNIYIAGITYDNDFPTTQGAFQAKLRGDNNVFVLKFDTNGINLEYSTFLGGDKSSVVKDIVIGKEGNLFLTGYTNSTNFPVTENAYQRKWGGFNLFKQLFSDEFPNDAFVSVINKSGTELIYSTYLGSKESDLSQSIAVDIKGNIYITGEANSKKFPVIPKNSKIKKRSKYGDGFLTIFSQVN